MWSSLVGELGEFMEGLFPSDPPPEECKESEFLALPTRRRQKKFSSKSSRSSRAATATTEVSV